MWELQNAMQKCALKNPKLGAMELLYGKRFPQIRNSYEKITGI